MSRGVDELLAALLPDARQTALLEACLHSGTRARAGWARWCEGRDGTEPVHALAAARLLLPLLARSAAANGLDLSPEVRAYVHAATLREERRAGRFRALVAEALAQLEADDVPVYVVRGVALAATAYPSWSLRHCHDLDLLIEPPRLAAAVQTLVRHGFVHTSETTAHDGARLRHASGLQVALHTLPFACAHYAVPASAFAAPGGALEIDGRRARMPCAEATLVHVLGHATYSPSRRTLRWVTDAWYLVAQRTDLDWRDVARRLAACNLALPAAALLDYLAALGVPVPAATRAAVRAHSETASAGDADIALGGALAATGGDVRALWRSASWRGRLSLARWALAPAPAYLRHEFRLAPGARVSPYYAYRPLRYWRRQRAAPADCGA